MSLTPVLKAFEQRVAALLDYDFDFRNFGKTDNLVSAVVEYSPNDGELVIDHIDTSGLTAKVWITGGIENTEYIVTCSVTSDEGRAEPLSIKLTILP